MKKQTGRLAMILRCAIAALIAAAAPAAAHEDYPAGFCGGSHCRPAEPGEVTPRTLPGGEVVFDVSATGETIPAALTGIWIGCVPLVCIADRSPVLTTCNLARGDCEPGSRGLVLPLWWFDAEAAALCPEAAGESSLVYAGLGHSRPVYEPGVVLQARGGELVPVTAPIPLPHSSLLYLSMLLALLLWILWRRSPGA